METELKSTGDWSQRGACRIRPLLRGGIFKSLAYVTFGLLTAVPMAANAGETWRFVDKNGVLHMGNITSAEKQEPADEESAGIPSDTELLPTLRDIKLINRTWTMRYPAWEPTAASVVVQSVFGEAAGQGKGIRLPRGFHDVKPYLDAAAQSHSVDPALIYSVAAAESAFNTEAVSHKGALGLMQIMPATAARYGVSGYSLSTGRHNVLEPQVNAFVGGRYLADLLRMFGGDTSLAVAAYNAGEGAVSKYGNRIPPYPETQKYVERVLGYYRSFKQ